MRYLTSLAFCLVFLPVVISARGHAQRNIHVNESATRAVIRDEGVGVDLVVENAGRDSIQANILAQLLGPQGHTEGQVELTTTLLSGSTKTRLTLPLPGPRSLERAKRKSQDLLWYRLRFRIAPNGVGEPVVSTISIGRLTPDFFELQVAEPQFVRESGHYTARVRAVHPLTGRPVAGVAVQASLDVQADDQKPLLTKMSTTDRRGFATLEFTLPVALDTDEVDVTVTGRLGDISQAAEGTLRVMHFSSVAISTDKALYQPGQTLHARLMAFDVNKKAIPDQRVAVKILDPDETLVYRTDVSTSRFGIASADWQIPANLRLGTYRIQARFGEGRYEDAGAATEVKISRYDLPAFSVTAKPDRTCYLPGQDASIDVSADYLFGKAVPRGHVRVARESERKWNYREQKWDVEEGAVYEGDTDERGHYLAEVELRAEQADLASEDYRRFHDVTFAAYLTDVSTGRTEQRRFDLRISKDAIHVYFVQGSARPAKGRPLEFYVSTDYADGTPAQCDVEISLVGEDTMERTLRRVRTNRYGVARVTGLTISDETGSGFDLSLRARDRKGLTGEHTESVSYPRENPLRVTTDKTLYKLGEPIAVQVAAAIPDLTVVVEAIRDYQVLSSRFMRLRHGHGEVTFDGDERFQNQISIVAYSFGSRSRYGFEYPETMGWRGVYFPKDQELKVDVKLAKSMYRPGEEANAELHVSGAADAQVKSALGLVVVDKAVEERARTDRDFGASGGGFYNFRELWESSDEIGGVHKSDLDKLDLSKPLPDGLELAAEILVEENGGGFWPEMFSSDSDTTDFRKLFACEIDPTMNAIQKALESRYGRTEEYPKTEASLEETLTAAGVRLEDLKDPWGVGYRVRFSVDRGLDVLEVFSAGPDKNFGTDDDFVALRMTWPYFKLPEGAMRNAVREFHTRTGGFIRDEEALKEELASAGVDPDAWKDPWGHTYRFLFGVDGSLYTITVTSAGPDGRFATKRAPSDDDFPVAVVRINYFDDWRAKIDAALVSSFKEGGSLPETFEQLQEALGKTGIRWEELRDPWGRNYYATFRQEFRYADNAQIESYEQHQAQVQKTGTVPVTQQMNWVHIRSAGPDQEEGTSDDFDVATFSRAVAEQRATDQTPVATKERPPLAGSSGAISGTVTDPVGAVIADATVKATNSATQETFSANGNDDGVYLLRNLPAGFYNVEFSKAGFRTYTITRVPVQSSNVTKLDMALNIGQVTETVEVSAQAVMLETTAATMAVSKATVASLPTLLATPRLREYFPETLFWQPEVVTDEKGRAHVKFPLADNITTWKLSAVASTLNGEMGTAEKEIRVFQPFFAELDPPRFLTVGDEISLPVVLRNYLDRQLQIKVEMKPAPWFNTSGPTVQQSDVAPRTSARDIFRFQARRAVSDGKQEVSAVGAGAADAIAKPVTVRPDGEEKTQSVSEVLRDGVSVAVNIPDEALPGTAKTTLKIYPNLTAHVLESIEAILERPYGCGEQTISSTYPSVLLLKYARGPAYEKSSIVQRARRYVGLGYERLLSYRTESGGFSYWGRGEADLALTVYAIRFLGDASEFVAVDYAVKQEALSWVVEQMKDHDYWVARDWRGNEDPRRSVLLTAYIARIIAEYKPASDTSPANSQLTKLTAAAMQRALAYLALHVKLLDEPYAISSYALAARAAGDDAALAKSVARLSSLEEREGDTSYWSIETNTPFYGWGLAGRVETTAVVLRALAEGRMTPEADALIDRGLLFLLHNQDRYGVWYSTQATVTVLDAMASLISRRGGASKERQSSAETAKAAILVDGQQVASIDLPPASVLSGPIDTDLSRFVSSGRHEVTVRRTAEAAPASLQLLEDYYVPWSHAAANTAWHAESRVPDALRLSVHFDKSSVPAGETVQCTVRAERIGFHGYGMLLGEIGLPPGADVDRASLEEAMKKSGWDVNQFDVLPDRLIVYLWPHAGGTTFSFTFKPRFGLNAQTAPSLLYDYYNPEAHAVIEPTRFVVQPR